MLSKVVSTPNIISDQLKPFNDVTDDHISFMNTNITTTARLVIMHLYGNAQWGKLGGHVDIVILSNLLSNIQGVPKRYCL